MSGLPDLPLKSLEGGDAALAAYSGQVLLIVNTASQCGFTPQYQGLETLHRTYAARGFAVLGFPCNQFGHQEPGEESEIRDFCAARFGVTFPLFAKTEVNGAHTHPLWAWLKQEKGGFLGAAIKWNFTKFLVNRQGAVTERFPPTSSPSSIAPKIEKLLAEPVPGKT